jgi:rod shape-determining protein MreC
VAKPWAKKNDSFAMAVGIGIGFFFSYVVWAPTNVAHIIASYLVYPVLVMQQNYVDPLKKFIDHKRTQLQLEQSVQILEHEKQELQAQLIALQATTSYAQEVKELVEFRQRYACSCAVLAHVIMKNISDQAHFFLLDAGTRKGVVKDMIAVWQNHIIGRVVEVYPLYSKVMLITDRTCKIAAYCLATQATGIYTGTNTNDVCDLNYVSHLMQMQEGDMVLSSGEGLVFPRGFALGTVTAYTVNGLLYAVKVKPLLDIHKINYCYILQKGAEFSLKDQITP